MGILITLVGMCLHASDRAVDCVADLLTHDMVRLGSCCSCVVRMGIL